MLVNSRCAILAGVWVAAVGCSSDDVATQPSDGSSTMADVWTTTGGTTSELGTTSGATTAEDGASTDETTDDTTNGATSLGSVEGSDAVMTSPEEVTSADPDAGDATNEESTDGPTIRPRPTAVNDAYEAYQGQALIVDAAQGLLANDDHPTGLPISVDLADAWTESWAGARLTLGADGSFEYIPMPGFSGRDEFRYMAVDSEGGMAPAWVTIEVHSSITALDTVISGEDGFVIEGDTALGQLGHGVDIVGDVNGDGLDDVVVGMISQSIDRPVAAVVFGRARGEPASLTDLLAGTGGFVIYPSEFRLGSYLISSPRAAGDVNGDGLADIVMRLSEGAPSSRGAVVVFGKADTDPVDLAEVGDGTGGFEILAAAATLESASGAGDLNGDGLGEVILGAGVSPYIVNGQAGTTAVNLVNLGERGTAIVSENGLAGLGTVDGGQDVNGDGVSDIAFDAAIPYTYGEQRCVVVFGAPFGPLLELSDVAAAGGGYEIIIDELGYGSITYTGHSCKLVGDVNGDDLADIAITGSVPSGDYGSFPATIVVFGKSDSATSVISGGRPGTGVGFTVDGLDGAVDQAGDVNGDGLGDLIFGHPYFYAPAGKAFVVFGGTGSHSRLATDIEISVGGFALWRPEDNDELGAEVSGGGDIDGDGRQDFVLAAPGSNGERGRVYVVLGSLGTNE